MTKENFTFNTVCRDHVGFVSPIFLRGLHPAISTHGLCSPPTPDTVELIDSPCIALHRPAPYTTVRKAHCPRIHYRQQSRNSKTQTADVTNNMRLNEQVTDTSNCWPIRQCTERGGQILNTVGAAADGGDIWNRPTVLVWRQTTQNKSAPDQPPSA
jgi:hypothetical protein